jgi:16S rRNA G966 N2-methylase RsmD
MTKLYTDKDYILIDDDKQDLGKIIYDYNGNRYNHLLFNNVSLYSVTPSIHSKYTLDNILKILRFDEEDMKVMNVLESSAGIGGNSLDMIHFGHFTSFEKDINQYNILLNNISVVTNMNSKNLKEMFINGDHIDFLKENKTNYYDIIFADPPWNFTKSDMISHDTIRYDENKTIEESIDDLLHNAETVVLKTFYKDDFTFYKNYFVDRPHLNLGYFIVANTKIIIISKRFLNYKHLTKIRENKLYKFDYKKYLVDKEQ